MPTPFQRIACVLAAVDSTPAGAAVWRYACGIALDRSARLQLLHVVDPDPHPGLPPRERHELMERVLEDLRRSAPDVDVATAVADGLPIDAILHAIEEYAADIVVVATHTHEDETRVSVSESLVRRAPCPVLAVRAGFE